MIDVFLGIFISGSTTILLSRKSNSFSLPSINGTSDDYEPNQQIIKQQRPSSDTKKVTKQKQNKQVRNIAHFWSNYLKILLLVLNEFKGIN